MRPIRRIIAAAAALATVAGVAACSVPAETSSPKSLIIGTTALWQATPAIRPAIFGPLGQTQFEGLYVLDDATDTFQPLLAKEFSLSDDGKTLSFVLHENVNFTDGTHMDAAAVAESFNTVTAKEDYIWRQTVHEDLGAEAVATGDYSLEIRVSQRLGISVLQILAQTGVISPAALENPPADGEPAGGTGPYLFDEQVQDVSISFVKNPDYWNADAIDFDSLTFQIFIDNIAALNALKSGQIDATQIDIGLAAEAESSGFAIHEGSGGYATLLVLDSAGETIPALGDVRVRQAMAMAFDRETILETIDLGYGSASSQPVIVETVPGYVEGGDDRWPYDVEAARELMDEAGYADGFDLTIPTGPGSGQYDPRYEPILQQSLADIGIRVTFELAADGGAWIEAWKTAPVAFMNQAPTNTLFALHTGEFFPLNRLMNDDTFALLDEYDTAATQGESEAAAAELGEYLLDNALYIAFAHPAVLWASNPEVDLNVGRVFGEPNIYSFQTAE